MTNKEKAREIAKAYDKSEYSVSFMSAIATAEWKDQQFKEYLENKLVDIRKENSCGPYGVGYNLGEQWIINEIINELFKEE